MKFVIKRVDGKEVYFSICSLCYPGLYNKIREQTKLKDFKQ